MSDPTPIPQPGVRASFRQLMWSLVVAVGSVRPQHVTSGCKSMAGVYWRNVSPFVSSLVLVAGLGYVAVQHGCAPSPQPPEPTPAPAPLSPLEQSIHDAYASDPDPQKATHAVQLADVTEPFVSHARQSGNVKTTSDLYKTWHDAATISPGKGTVPNVAKAIAVYLDANLPTQSTVMTDQLWLTADARFRDVAAALRKAAK